jgi:hypothetical protein
MYTSWFTIYVYEVGAYMYASSPESTNACFAKMEQYGS